MRARLAAFAGLVGLVAGCSATPQPAASSTARGFVAQSGGFMQTPPFSRLGFAPFMRAEVVAVALREWRLWGSPVDDDPPGSRPPRGADEKPERYPGLWERVGEYWWTGMDEGTRFASWTGKHDETGTEYPASGDGRFAWSAAFIDYVMRVAGAADRFPYSAAHADYINAAHAVALAPPGGLVITAERPEVYAPQPGDLICLGRGRGAALTYDDLPASFPAHCDIVVAAQPGLLTVIGGNVDDAVTEKHVPTTPDGLLMPPGGPVVDVRYPWFVVLKLVYAG